MKSIKELINEKRKLFNFSEIEAKNFVCQQIIINKIANSEMADKTLLKGGVVMFNMTKNVRRVTRDIDFDLVHYDIFNEQSMKNFVYMLNKVNPEYTVEYISSEQLRQEDYKGRRLHLEIKDKSISIKYAIDVGVHTLFPIKQIDSIFVFDKSSNGVKVRVNPPEQIVAEKLYSLAKIGVVSTRTKDIYDVYYLLKNCKVDKNAVRQCFDLLLQNKNLKIKTINDIVTRIKDTLDNEIFAERVLTSKTRWLDLEYSVVKQAIIDFIENI